MSGPAAKRDATLRPRFRGGGSFKVVGLGGVGGIVARYLAVFLAAQDAALRLVLVDGDAFEDDNAARMIFARRGNKAAVVSDALRDHVVDSRLTLLAVGEYVTAANSARLIREGDVVLLAVDNHATRKLVNDACAALRDVCLVSGGNDGVGEDSGGRARRGTYGNAQIYVRRDGCDLTPDLTRFHPEIATPADVHPVDAACTEMLASTPQILFANLTTAAAMLNTLWLHLCGALHYGELSFDIHDGLMRPAW